MSKPTLGRGLGDLLGHRRVVGQAVVTPPRVDGGLRILIDGAAHGEEPVATKTATAKTSEAGAVRMLAMTALIGADVALLGWAVWFTFAHEHALGFLSASLCTLSVLTAACCGCAATLLLPGGE